MTHEDIASRRLWQLLAIAIVVGLLAVGAAAALLRVWRGPAPSAVGERAAPRIAQIHQTPIRTDRHGWREREAARAALDRYGWADRDAGVAQIPIQTAMDLVVRELASGGER